MNTKSSWIILALLLLAILFVPIIPELEEEKCKDVRDSLGVINQVCDDNAGYISVYNKYFSK